MTEKYIVSTHLPGAFAGSVAFRGGVAVGVPRWVARVAVGVFSPVSVRLGSGRFRRRLRRSLLRRRLRLLALTVDQLVKVVVQGVLGRLLLHLRVPASGPPMFPILNVLTERSGLGGTLGSSGLRARETQPLISMPEEKHEGRLDGWPDVLMSLGEPIRV
eukprot:1188863-Prorocentrum_minimum.AAC.6